MHNPLTVNSSYCSAFYIPQNIIGFTGHLHDNPTVYFMSETEFGHITQHHDLAMNIGRAAVGKRFPFKGAKYVIENELVNGQKKGIEKYVSDAGKSLIRIHPSRNRYVDCSAAGTDVLDILSQAIWLHHNEKNIFQRKNIASRVNNCSDKHFKFNLSTIFGRLLAS